MKFKSVNELLSTKVGSRPENASLLGALQTQVAKPGKRREVEDPKLEQGKSSLAFSIGLIVVSRRLMDEHDNLRAACKPLVDSITGSLGFEDDADPRLQWHYHQIKGRTQGVIVSISQI